MWDILTILIAILLSINCQSKQQLEYESKEMFQQTKTFCWPNELYFCKEFNFHKENALISSMYYSLPKKEDKITRTNTLSAPLEFSNKNEFLSS